MNSADLSTISPGSQLATRLALLDAAERLFSQNGIEGTSVRDIIKAAGANLGAINYHFGTKDRLALEVFARRIEPVNRERIARLDALEAGVGRRKLKLEQILDALIRPALESEEQGAKNCDDFMRLISRSFQEPNAEVKKFVEQQFAEVAHRFDSAILRAVPGLPAGGPVLAYVLSVRGAAPRVADVASVRPDALCDAQSGSDEAGPRGADPAPDFLHGRRDVRAVVEILLVHTQRRALTFCASPHDSYP